MNNKNSHRAESRRNFHATGRKRNARRRRSIRQLDAGVLVRIVYTPCLMDCDWWKYPDEVVAISGEHFKHGTLAIFMGDRRMNDGATCVRVLTHAGIVWLYASDVLVVDL